MTRGRSWPGPSEAVDVDLFDEVPRSCGRVLLADGPEVDHAARRLRDAAYEVIRSAPGQTAEMLAAAAVDEDVDAVVTSTADGPVVDELRRALADLGSPIAVRTVEDVEAGAGPGDLRTSGPGGARCS